MNLHDATPTFTFWATADGQQIPFTQLTTDHIRNILRYPWRPLDMHAARKAMLDGVRREARRRGIPA